MSTTILAPHFNPEVSITLPNPKLSNSINSNNTVKIIRSMDGTRRTYVKTNDDVTLRMEFDLSRLEAQALYELIFNYVDKKVRVITFDNTTYVCNILTNPVQLQFKNRWNSVDFLLELRGRVYG